MTLEHSQIAERKQKNMVIDNLVGIEEAEALILFYAQTIWKIVHSLKVSVHIGLVAVKLYKIFTLNTSIKLYDCKIAAISSVFLAIKLENGYQVSLSTICNKIKGTDPEAVKDTELLILKGNEYDCYVKTPWLPLLSLYNDFEGFSEEDYKAAVTNLEMTITGDIIYENKPSKLATAAALKVFIKTDKKGQFKFYLEQKYTLAKQNDMCNTSFNQWYKELEDLVQIMSQEIKLDQKILKDVHSRIVGIASPSSSIENNSALPTQHKRSLPSPETTNRKK